MENTTSKTPQTVQVVPVTPVPTVSVIDHDQLLQLLLDRAVQRNGRGDTFVVEYATDMLGKGKLRASARAVFQEGINHIVRKTIQVNYDYATKVENRTDGAETAKGGPTWQHAVEINGHLTPLTVHRADVATETPLTFIPGARAYLRYEPLTDAQKQAGFGKGDYDRYQTDSGEVIPYETVEPFFFDREKTTVNHRTLSLSNITGVRLSGIVYQVR